MRHFIIAAILFANFVFGITPQRSPTGKVVQIVGGAKSAERPLSYGDFVYAGEVIRTDGGSRVKILMSDRSIIDIGEDSAIRIRTYPANANAESARELDLELGSIRASVKKSPTGQGRFFIRTKSSVLAVRGTEFGVTLVAGNVSLSVFDGSVRFGNLDVVAGQTLQQMGGNLPPIVRGLSVKEIADTHSQYTTTSTVGDATNLIAGDLKGDRTLASFDRISHDPRQYVYNNAPGQPNGQGDIDKGNRGSNGIPVAVLIIYDQTVVRR